MLEFKTIETSKLNTEILEIIKDYTYKVKKGKIKHIIHTNYYLSVSNYII